MIVFFIESWKHDQCFRIRAVCESFYEGTTLKVWQYKAIRVRVTP